MGGDSHDHDEALNDGCAFCMGREAVHFGDPPERNPFPPTAAVPRSPEWWDAPHVLWDLGYGVGGSESDGQPPHEETVPGYERRQQIVRLSTGFHALTELMAIVTAQDPAARRMDHAERLDATDALFGGELEWSVTYWAATG